MATGLGGPPWGDYPPLSQDQGDSYHAGPTLPGFMDRDGFYGELRFLRIQGIDGRPLPEAPFMIRKSVHKSAGGKIEGAFPESGGKTYALKVRQLTFYQRLLDMKKLNDGTPIEVIEHPGFNQTRCVVSCREVVNVDVNVLLEEMQEQGVKEIRRILRRAGGKQINTPTLIVTTRGTVRPEFLDFGFIRCRTRPYYPSPMQCFSCWAFGHTRSRCNSSPICGRCAQNHAFEPEHPCIAAKYCKKCESSDHGVGDRSCPEYIKEGDIQRIRVDSNLSYAAARRKYEEAHGTRSYANMTAVPGFTSLNNQNDLASLHRKIDSLIATIEKKDQRIEQLEAALAQRSSTAATTSVPNVSSQTGDDMPTFMKLFLDRQEQMFGNTVKKMWESNLRMQKDILELQSRSELPSDEQIYLPAPLQANTASLSTLPTRMIAATKSTPTASAVLPNSTMESSEKSSPTPTNIKDKSNTDPLNNVTPNPVSPATKTIAIDDSSHDLNSDVSSDSSSSPNRNLLSHNSTPRPSPKTPVQSENIPKAPLRAVSPGSANKRTLRDISPDRVINAQTVSKQQRRSLPRSGHVKKS